MAKLQNKQLRQQVYLNKLVLLQNLEILNQLQMQLVNKLKMQTVI